jgi:hypothetical protein
MVIALVLLGIVLLIVGWLAPLPHPGNLICVWAGAACLIVALIVFILAVVGTASTPPDTYHSAPCPCLEMV